MNKNLEEKIKKLRKEGKTYSEIQTELGCSKGTISFHLGEGQKEKNINRQKKYRKENINIILGFKINNFKQKYKRETEKINKTKKQVLEIIRIKTAKYKFRNKDLKMNNETEDFTVEQVINLIGENPKCYLTGKTIDLTDPKSYHFDHKIPSSRGGKNTLDNLGICTKEANLSKSNLSIDEYIQVCKDVLNNFGYNITKN